MAQKKFNGRVFASLAAAAGFLIMGLTGIILYLVPQGRIAYWTEWRLAGLTKTQWGDIHTLGMFLFLIAGAFHLYFNWRVFINYLSDRASAGVKHGREMLIACLVLVVVVVAGTAPFPPLSWLLDLRDSVKDSWVISKEYEPPFGHAELLSFRTLAQKTNVPLDQALAELKKLGLKIPSPRMTVAELAALNGLSPMVLWSKVAHLEKPIQVQNPPGEAWTAQKVEESFAGTGIGNKTLAEIAKIAGQNLDKVRARLKVKGLKLKDGESIKQAATRLGLNPLDLLKSALVDDFKLR